MPLPLVSFDWPFYGVGSFSYAYATTHDMTHLDSNSEISDTS